MDNKLKLTNVTVTFKPVTRQIKNKFQVIFDKMYKEANISPLDYSIDSKTKSSILSNEAIERLLIAEKPYDYELKELGILSVCDNENMNDARNIFDFLEDVILVPDVDDSILVSSIISYISSYWQVDKKK